MLTVNTVCDTNTPWEWSVLGNVRGLDTLSRDCLYVFCLVATIMADTARRLLT